MDDITIMLEEIKEESRNLTPEMFDQVRDQLESVLDFIRS